ncbi:hypothetical protein A9G05_24325 [Pseudomonas sp. ENNP23]|nr:hypothetical protein A9G05_24325 [Pseudomonas sp. ENNP23]
MLPFYLNWLKNDISVWLIDLWQSRQRTTGLRAQNGNTSVASKRVVNLITIKSNIKGISARLHKIHWRVTKMPIIHMPNITKNPFIKSFIILPEQIIFHAITPQLIKLPDFLIEDRTNRCAHSKHKL